MIPRNTRAYPNSRQIFIRHIGIRVSESLADSLSQYAEDVGKTPSECAREAIAEYLRVRKGLLVHGESVIPWVTKN